LCTYHNNAIAQEFGFVILISNEQVPLRAPTLYLALFVFLSPFFCCLPTQKKEEKKMCILYLGHVAKTVEDTMIKDVLPKKLSLFLPFALLVCFCSFARRGSFSADKCSPFLCTDRREILFICCRYVQLRVSATV
jgi:hypothetical protein